MPDPTTPGTGGDLQAQAASTANRLRLLQIDFADASADERRGHLEDEIGRAIARVVPDEREAFLELLQEMFPAWDANVEVAPRAEQSVSASRVDERELKDGSFLVSRLADLAPHMTEEEKLGLAARLARAGIAVPSSGGAFPDAAAEKLRQRLSVPVTTPLDAARTVELAGLLAELAVSLDQVVWNTWKTIAPRSDFRRSGDMARSMGRFASGDPDVSRGQIKQDLERVRQLVAALISSVGQAGRQFAQRHFTRFSIEAIKEAAGPGTIMKPQTVKCWEKYVELAGPMDAVAMESELLQAIAKYAEDLVKGLNR